MPDQGSTALDPASKPARNAEALGMDDAGEAMSFYEKAADMFKQKILSSR